MYRRGRRTRPTRSPCGGICTVPSSATLGAVAAKDLARDLRFTFLAAGQLRHQAFELGTPHALTPQAVWPELAQADPARDRLRTVAGERCGRVAREVFRPLIGSGIRGRRHLGDPLTELLVEDRSKPFVQPRCQGVSGGAARGPAPFHDIPVRGLTEMSGPGGSP